MMIALAALSCSLPLAADHAEACGGSYQRRPQLLSTKTHGDDTRPAGTRRMFVDLGPAGKLADGVAWRRLDRMSFDDSAIAPLPQRVDQARTITVVGRTGTRVVTSRAHWLLRPAFQRGEPRLVVEVEAAGTAGATGIEPQLALVGSHDARWQEPVYVEARPEHTRWMTARVELAKGEHVHVAQLGDLELLTAVTPKGVVTIARRGGAEVVRESDTVLGGLTLAGRPMLVVLRAGALDTVEL